MNQMPEHIAINFEMWRLNLWLECSGASLNELESIAIGGAVLKLRDLHEVLEWFATQGIEAGTGETRQGLDAKHESPVGEADAPDAVRGEVLTGYGEE